MKKIFSFRTPFLVLILTLLMPALFAQAAPESGPAKTASPPVEQSPLTVFDPDFIYLENGHAYISSDGDTKVKVAGESTATVHTDKIGVQVTLQRWTGSTWVDVFEAIKFVRTLDSNLEANLDESILNQSNLLPLLTTPYFSFRYLTFIPNYKIKNPWPTWTTPDYPYQTYFLGNNRSFDVLAFQNSKTEQNIDITFDQTPYSTYDQRTFADATNLVDGSNNVLWTGQAVCEQSPWYGTDHTKAFDLYLISPNSYGLDTKQFGAGGDCGIPYRDYLSPDITYYYDAWIERDGDWRVKGSHDKAPSHEFYIYDTSIGNYTTIFQHNVQLDSNGDPDFNYLLPIYPNWTFDISG